MIEINPYLVKLAVEKTADPFMVPTILGSGAIAGSAAAAARRHSDKSQGKPVREDAIPRGAYEGMGGYMGVNLGGLLGAGLGAGGGGAVGAGLAYGLGSMFGSGPPEESARVGGTLGALLGGGAGLAYGAPKGFEVGRNFHRSILDKNEALARQRKERADAKTAFIQFPIEAGIGALSAPKGHRAEGAERGIARGEGVLGGGAIGALSGGAVGAGLGGLAGLATGSQNANQHALSMALGGGSGALLGALLGGYKGWNYAGNLIGRPSWEHEKKKHPEE